MLNRDIKVHGLLCDLHVDAGCESIDIHVNGMMSYLRVQTKGRKIRSSKLKVSNKVVKSWP